MSFKLALRVIEAKEDSPTCTVQGRHFCPEVELVRRRPGPPWPGPQVHLERLQRPRASQGSKPLVTKHPMPPAAARRRPQNISTITKQPRTLCHTTTQSRKQKTRLAMPLSLR